MIRLANTRNCGRVCLFYRKETTIFSHAKRTVRVLRRFTQLLFSVGTSSIATATKKETMITSTHNLLSSFLQGKVIHFLLSRKCKLDRDFLHLELRFLVCVIVPITKTVFKPMLRRKGKSKFHLQNWGIGYDGTKTLPRKWSEKWKSRRLLEFSHSGRGIRMKQFYAELK